MRPKATSSYLDLEGLAEAEESWTEQQVEVFQLTQLRRTIRMAETSCPLYQRRFAEYGVSYLDLHTAKDLAKFPLLTQQDVENNLDELVNQNFGRKAGRRASDRKAATNPAGSITSTTSKGTPSEQKEKVFLEQLLRRCGISARDRIVFVWDEFNMSKARSKHLSLNLKKRWMTLSAAEVTPDSASSMLDKVVGFKPHVLVGYPSAVTTLALQLQQEKRQLRRELRTLICTGERLDKSQQRFLEKAFDTRVVGRYVQPNRLAVATQTLHNDLYHFSPGYGFAELGEPDTNGMCEIIATSFHDDKLPLVRYRTGDLVAAPVTEQASKAFPWLAVEKFVGRSNEFLVSRSGKKVWPVQLALDEKPFEKIVSIQLFQDRPGYVLLRYISTNGLTEPERKQVKRRLSVAIGKEFKILLKETRWLPKDERGTLPWLVRSDFAIPSTKEPTKKKSRR